MEGDVCDRCARDIVRASGEDLRPVAPAELPEETEGAPEEA